MKKHKILIKITMISILCLFTLYSSANIRKIECKVVGISDGDTLTCLKDNTPLKIRLLYIDAPESAQPFGNKAKQALASLAFKKNIKLNITGYDKYHRSLGVVFDEANQNINLKMVELGLAWAYKKTQPIYQQAQQTAQSAKRGLWQDKNPINPADWRANKSSNAYSQNKMPIAPLAPLTTDINCSQKLSCKQFERQGMSYAQVEQYFKQCNWKELDGNQDGIPCNRLYRKAKNNDQ